MKNVFTEQEIEDFLLKLSREIQGEALLLPTTPTMIDPVQVVKAMSSPSEYAEMMMKISLAEGMVKGKLEIFRRFLNFFQIQVSEQ
jgi:hypothetical protein